jgi:hypothetical protein
MKNQIRYFTTGYTDSNYSVTNNQLSKRALILVEGVHIDSNKRKHEFNSDRIEKIADNTNTLFNQGANIPLLADHNKTVNSALGNLESPVYVEMITEDNLPNKKARHLLGKLGIFADEIVVKSKDAIDKVANNIVNTISAGLDISTDTIREISLTPTPAILGMSLYKSHLANTANFEDSGALTFDDLDNNNDQMSQMEEMYGELTAKLWTLTKNIQMADEDMLQGNDPMMLQEQAIQDFVDRFMDLIGANDQEENQEQYQDPRLQQQGGGQNPQQSMGVVNSNSRMNQRAFSSDFPVAAFSMSEMEHINAEFGRGKDKKKRKIRWGRVAAGAAGLLGAGALAYGAHKYLKPKTALNTPTVSNATQNVMNDLRNNPNLTRGRISEEKANALTDYIDNAVKETTSSSSTRIPTVKGKKIRGQGGKKNQQVQRAFAKTMNNRRLG